MLILAIVLLIFSILLGVYYTWGMQRRRYEHQPIILFCLFAVLFLAGNIMLFIAKGWQWGLTGIGIFWLVLLVTQLGTISVSAFLKGWNRPVQKERGKRVNEVVSIKKQHYAEIDDFWNLTSPNECASLMISFLDELRLNWTREYSQLNPERLPDSISKMVKNKIELAYKAGYMTGKGWISKEHLADYNLYLGDMMAGDIMTIQQSKSRGIAFASGYSTVAAHAHLKVVREKIGSS